MNHSRYFKIELIVKVHKVGKHRQPEMLAHIINSVQQLTPSTGTKKVAEVYKVKGREISDLEDRRIEYARMLSPEALKARRAIQRITYRSKRGIPLDAPKYGYRNGKPTYIQTIVSSYSGKPIPTALASLVQS